MTLSKKPTKKLKVKKQVKSKKTSKTSKKDVKKKAIKEKISEVKSKINWEIFPDEEPTEKEYLDEEYPEDEGFGKDETDIMDDYEKVPREEEDLEIQ